MISVKGLRQVGLVTKPQKNDKKTTTDSERKQNMENTKMTTKGNGRRQRIKTNNRRNPNETHWKGKRKPIRRRNENS